MIIKWTNQKMTKWHPAVSLVISFNRRCKDFYSNEQKMVLLAHHLTLYFPTYLGYIVSPWAVFQLASLLVPWKIIYVELAGALYQIWIEPRHGAIKINNSWGWWYRIPNFLDARRKIDGTYAMDLGWWKYVSSKQGRNIKYVIHLRN